MKIGTKIRILREKNNLTQAEFSSKLGIAQTTLGNIESGNTHKIDFKIIENICKVLEVDFEYFTEKIKLKQVNKDNSVGYIADYQSINLSEKLIEQFEMRLKEKDELIRVLSKNI